MSFTYTSALQTDTISLHLIFIYPRFSFFYSIKTDVKERESTHLFIHRRVSLVHTDYYYSTLHAPLSFHFFNTIFVMMFTLSVLFPFSGILHS